jgi:dephospho-CoA kinase
MIKQDDVVLVAITGGMGCGQSSVATFLEEMGAKIINADQMAHKVVNSDPEAKNEIRKNFGKKVFFRNGKLNRKLLGRIVFEDEAKTKLLNKIVHPRMVSRIVDEIEEARDTGKYKIIAIDAALIYEINLEHMFDAVVVVSSRLKNRIDRIVERDGLSEKEILDRISKQIPIEDKVKWADFVINNNSSLEQLKKRTVSLYHKLVKKAGRR